MAKRLFDIGLAVVALLMASPFLALGALGILLTSPGPIVYAARRVGKDGRVFTMYKLRTMHVASDSAGAITAPGDSRIFAVGNLIRRTKIDEFPQFWNVLRGDMSIVGPRAEAPVIVEQHYTDWMRETLSVAPGVTSPGALYYYYFADDLIDPADVDGSYVHRMLAPKLALERAYVENRSFIRDIGYVLFTIVAITALVLGRELPLPARDLEMARRWAPQGPYKH